MLGKDFKIYELIEDYTTNEHFHLHVHESYEILLFLEGDSKFIIEGRDYFLESGDVIIVRKDEMHRIFHNSDACYHRIVLFVTPPFFVSHNCAEYEKQFLNTQMGIDNRIKSDYVRSCGLYDAFMRLKKYSCNYTLDYQPIIDAIVMEILFLINQTGHFTSFNSPGSQVEQIISYINNHFTEDIDLDLLAKHFFISKSYLCKIFHKSTGLTIHNYISRKRINKAREYHQAGKNIGDAAMLSGFSDYTSFYRTYKKLTGCSPKKDIVR